MLDPISYSAAKKSLSLRVRGMTMEEHATIPHTSAMIADGTIVDADISPTAAIAGSKLNPAIPGKIADILTDHDLANHPLSIIPMMDLNHIPSPLTGKVVDTIAPGVITDVNIAANAAIAQSKLALTADPGAHASRHASGGADEITSPLNPLALPSHDHNHHLSPVLPEDDVHKTAIPIDHPDLSITNEKIVSVEREKVIDFFNTPFWPNIPDKPTVYPSETHDNAKHASPVLPEDDEHRIGDPIDHPDGSIPPRKLKAVNTPEDGQAPVYDEASGSFRWTTAGVGGCPQWSNVATEDWPRPYSSVELGAYSALNLRPNPSYPGTLIGFRAPDGTLEGAVVHYRTADQNLETQLVHVGHGRAWLIATPFPGEGSFICCESDSGRIYFGGRFMFDPPNRLVFTDMELIPDYDKGGQIGTSVNRWALVRAAEVVTDGFSIREEGEITRLAYIPPNELMFHYMVLRPEYDNTGEIGTDTHRWSRVRAVEVVTGALGLKSEKGDWVIEEAEDGIYAINNRTGKKYRMVMEEVE